MDATSQGPTAAAASAGHPEHTADLLRRSAARSARIMQAVMPAQTEPRYYAIMGALAEADAISQKDLADRLNINRTVMVKLIDRLEAAGFVVRSRNPGDRRSYVLTLTDPGRRARDLMGPAIARGEAELGAPLTVEEKRRINELLGRLMPDLDASLPHPAHRRTGYLLTQADLRTRRRLEQALAAVDLAPRHFSALTALDLVGPCPQQQLAQHLGVAETAMVLTVDELQERGLVERDRDAHDRRRYALVLTEAGEHKLRDARKAVDALDAEIAGQLGVADDTELRTLLAKLAED